MTIHGSGDPRAVPIIRSLKKGRPLFSLVLSYTRTAEIPGITVAGAGPDAMRYTPPADAEYIEYGYCKCMDAIPATPDGKPTPAVLTRAALLASAIPHIAVNAGCPVSPRTPHIDAGLEPGGNILYEPAMPPDRARRALDAGRRMGGKLASLCDCLVIGESIPGGTTTALATLRGLNLPGPVSSSMPENPTVLKERVARAALARLEMDDPVAVASKVADPMILAVCGMLQAATESAYVVLAGGTQMLAVLALASKLGYDHTRAALATTSYIAEDAQLRLAERVDAISPVPLLWTDPLLAGSEHAGLRAYAAGFAKEGAGAGGALVAARAKTGAEASEMLRGIDAEYSRLTGAGAEGPGTA